MVTPANQHTCQPPNHRMSASPMKTLIAALSTIILALGAIKTAEPKEQQVKPPINRLLVMTIAPRPSNEAFKRFNSSIEAYELELVVLGAELARPSDADRVDLLRKALAVYKSEQDLLIMVVDSDNLIINGNKNDILARFTNKFKSETRIVFSTDPKCWPDESLTSKYPKAATSNSESPKQRYLSSDAFVGYAPKLWDLLSLPADAAAAAAAARQQPGKQSDKWQLYFTGAYLNAETRQRLAIELDHRAELFQNLHSIESDVEIEFDTDSAKLKNSAYSTEPVIVHDSGPSKVSVCAPALSELSVHLRDNDQKANRDHFRKQIILNSLGNYLGKAWTVRDGCRHCNATRGLLSAAREMEPLPLVLVGLFVEEPTPFFADFLTSFHQLDYPRERMHLFIHSSVEYHDKQLQQFVSEHGSEYASQQFERQQQQADEWVWRDYALEKCKQLQCDYYLALDSIARLDEPKTLRYLIEANKLIVAPLLSRPTKLWSNFWGSITPDGFYARSHDYVQLVKRERVGIWNVPHLMNAYLIEGNFIRDNLGDKESSWKLGYREPSSPQLKPILAFSQRLRAKGVFQFVVNTHEFGHLVDPTSYNTSRTNPDFYQLKDNMLDWEQHYLHENYSRLVADYDGEDNSEGDETSKALGIANEKNSSTLMEQPCPDVYWFPLVSDRFCHELTEIMETFGQWSGGTNDDPRIEGGYESVPTRDIHFRQVGLHNMWLLFLREYVMPIQLKQFVGYEHDPPRADLAFVVRYHPAEQASLRPHHDSSTYTLNIALNSPGQDYQGGGCRFVRYNCSVVQSRKGWALLHPGRLTHYHEGLPVTNGTRYIMVTFVDP